MVDLVKQTGSQERFKEPWVEGHMLDSTSSLQVKKSGSLPGLTIYNDILSKWLKFFVSSFIKEDC